MGSIPNGRGKTYMELSGMKVFMRCPLKLYRFDSYFLFLYSKHTDSKRLFVQSFEDRLFVKNKACTYVQLNWIIVENVFYSLIFRLYWRIYEKVLSSLSQTAKSDHV